MGAGGVLPIERRVGDLPSSGALSVTGLAAADFAMLAVGDGRDVGVTLAAADLTVH